ncbi:MAG: zinc-ribbon domain-containing protein [Lachnospiraceae bacterium]|nr:zinc-ribbon domain-containing protein [Lachnospiraceae bacterium]
MFCPNCGAKIPDIASFCTSCGATIPKPAAPVPMIQMPDPSEEVIDLRGVTNDDAVHKGKDVKIILAALLTTVLWILLTFVCSAAVESLHGHIGPILSVSYLLSILAGLIAMGIAFLFRKKEGKVKYFDKKTLAVFLVLSVLTSMSGFLGVFDMTGGIGKLLSVVFMFVLLFTYLLTMIIMANQLPKGSSFYLLASFAASLIVGPLLGYLLAVLLDKSFMLMLLLIAALVLGGYGGFVKNAFTPNLNRTVNTAKQIKTSNAVVTNLRDAIIDQQEKLRDSDEFARFFTVLIGDDVNHPPKLIDASQQGAFETIAWDPNRRAYEYAASPRMNEPGIDYTKLCAVFLLFQDCYPNVYHFPGSTMAEIQSGAHGKLEMRDDFVGKKLIPAHVPGQPASTPASSFGTQSAPVSACPQCGRKRAAGEKFCGGCGYQF